MKSTPMYDTQSTLNEICSREDYKYKRSLRNNMAPVFVPEPGKYEVAAMDPNSRKKKEKAKPQLTPLERRIRELRREQQQAMINSRLDRIVRNEDKFARLAEKENLNMPCVGNMVEKKLIYDTADRNKLAELNYLLHRKRDYTPDRDDSRSRDRSPQNQDQEVISGFKKDRKKKVSDKNRASTTYTADRTHSGIPFLIGDTRIEDEIVLEGTEDGQERSGDIEVIKYDKPSPFDACSKEELMELVECMDKEMNDLKKDLEDEKRKVGSPGERLPPKSFLQKMKNYLIRCIWDLGDLKNDIAEKDRKHANLLEYIKRLDPTIDRRSSTVDTDLASRLFERTAENENMLRLVEDLLEKVDKERLEGDKSDSSRNQPPKGAEHERLVDQLEAVKAENELLNEFFKQFRTYDDSIVKLNNKQLLEKGSKLSIELLLRSLDKQTTDLNEKTSLLKRHQDDLMSLQKKVVQLESIYSSLKEGYEKDTQALLQLLMFGQEHNRDSLTDQFQVMGMIREKITNLKLQNEEARSKANILSQMEKVKDDEIRDIRDKLLILTHQVETMNLEKAQLEENLRYNEIEKNNIQDLQFSNQEEMKRRIKAESKKTIDELTDKVRSLTQKTTEQEQTIHSLASQLSMPSSGTKGIDKETMKLAINQLMTALYQQELVSAFDTRAISYLEDQIGVECVDILLNYDDFAGKFKYLMNLLESLYQENVISL
jgi:hypothetical protein